jgi:hypothetical protein
MIAGAGRYTIIDACAAWDVYPEKAEEPPNGGA